MKKIDKTKINIKVDKLSTTSRKELLNKFIEAGGKITDEEKSDTIVKKIDKTKRILNKEKQFLKDDVQKNLPKNLKTRIPRFEKNNQPDNKPGLLVKFSYNLLIRLRLYFMNITDFSASNFNNKFFHLFTTEYKIALMGINILCLEIFKQNHDLAHQIIYKLEKINPFDVRLVEQISKLYNEREFENIIKEYLKSPETTQPITGIKEQLLSMFKKIYLLKPYEHNIFAALEKSIEYYIKETNKKYTEYNLKRKNLKNDLYIIFEKIFPALYWLFCRYHNKIIALGSPEIETALKIKPDNMEKNIPESNVKVELNQEQPSENPDKEKKQLSEDEIAGFEILKHIIPANINELRSLYDRSNTYIHVKNNDKMLYVYLIFQEFDAEYSFLLTTNKIKYKFEYLESGSISFKDKFLDLYDNIKNNMDLLKEYANSFDILLKVQNEKPLTNDRYIAYSKEITTLLRRRQQAANSARFSLFSYMSEISNILRSLINDINGSGKIIYNTNDIIRLEISSDKNKKLNNKTISESLTMAYSFANAFAYRLSTGDLSGELEFNEQEFSKDEDKKNGHQVNDSGNTAKEESIMDELDDIADK